MQPPETTGDFVAFALIRHIPELFDDPDSYGSEEEVLAWLSSFRSIATKHDIDFDEIAKSESLHESVVKMNRLALSFGRTDLEVELDGDSFE